MAESNRTGTEVPQSCIEIAFEANAQVESCARVAISLLRGGDQEDVDAAIGLLLRMKDLSNATMSALRSEELEDARETVSGMREEAAHG